MKKLRYLFGLVIIIIAVLVIVPEFKESIPEIPNLLKNANKFLLLVIILFQIFTYFSDAWVTKILFKIAGYNIALLKTLKISLVDTLANLTLPLIGGQIIKYYFYKKLRVTGEAILFLLTAWTLFFGFAAFTFFAVAVIFLPQEKVLISKTILLFFLAAALIFIYFLIRRGKQIFSPILRFCAGCVNVVGVKFKSKKNISQERLDGFIINIAKTFSTLKTAKKELYLSLSATFFYYLCDILTVYFSFLVFGYKPNIFVVIFGFSLSFALAFISAIPYVPGIVESSLAIVFIKLGFPVHISLLAALLFRLFSYWLPMPFGVATYISLLRERKGELKQVKLQDQYGSKSF